MEHQNNFNYLEINEMTDINGGNINPVGPRICIYPPPTVKIDPKALLKRR